ncbi:MAG: ASKHA domain-containing protein [Oscillospiraceae bacterium]
MKLTLFTQAGTQVMEVEGGQTILGALRLHGGLPLHAPCGGKGICQKCTVYLLENGEERPVLACRTPVMDGMLLRVTTESDLAVETGAAEAPVCVPDAGLTGYGIACDIGTTTVVCHLVDRASGACLATLGEGNAQRPYGADVISRIKASMEGRRETLTGIIRSQLSGMVGKLCGEAGISPDAVCSMAVAANTTMCHLLAGLAPDSLGAAPFTPLSRFGSVYEAKALDLPFEGEVYITPAVSGYVGGDITADLLATGMDRAEKPVLLIDVGTNGEMALGCGDHFICCSTAAGPAFEGAQIRHGMTAAPGAISRVEYTDGALKLGVIGGGEAQGICGSGLIDAVAVMLILGALDETGRLLDAGEDEIPEAALPYLFLLDDEEPAFRLTDKICVTQADVRKLQLGKGAIAAGERVLLDACGLDYKEIGGLILSGGFGSYIRPESAARIGLIPEELLPVTRAAGNTAALGARMALLSAGARERLSRLQANMNYLELSGLPAFNAAYMESMMFPEEESGNGL